ncbi:MAG TPA: sulfatase-like hydrolase/transferase [Mycobacteriales bacterium]|jgi:arylsulfatase A-like enzyme|nr:sulfatase-like hydrolase/transferase [Mycobacteriales bacterium]
MTRAPNIVMIMSDQHRFDCCEPYGNQQVRTPALAELAADGVVYDAAFCAFPVCAPSRYSLLTGRTPRQHLCWRNDSTLPAGMDTFPRQLRNGGYRTAAVGKLHLTPAYLDVGFDRMTLAEQDGAGRLVDDFHRDLRRHGLIDRGDLTDQVARFRQHASPEYWENYGAIASDLPEESHSTTWIGDNACREIVGWDPDEPNLLFASFIKPHHPFDPAARWLAGYADADLDPLPGCGPALTDRDAEFADGYFPHGALTDATLIRVMRHYYAAISQVDHQIGRMLDLLRQRDLYDDTVIVYTSDHGEYLGHHGLLLKGGLLYEPLARVPLIIKYPHSNRSGGRDDGLTSGIDIAPTLLSLAGLAPMAASGRDLTPGPADREVLVVDAPNATQLMARTRTHKLILRLAGDPLLFDLSADPHEFVDVYDDPRHRDSRELLMRRLLTELAFGQAPVPHRDPAPVTLRGGNIPNDPTATAAEMNSWIDSMMRPG